jgi:hypothetical protein
MSNFVYYNASGPIQVNPVLFQQTYKITKDYNVEAFGKDNNEWIIIAAYYKNPSSSPEGYSMTSSHGVFVTIQNKFTGRIHQCFLVSLNAINTDSND